MRVERSDNKPGEVDADLLCIGIFDGDELPAEFADARGAGDVKTAPKKLTMLRPETGRVLVVGLGGRDDFDTESARVAAALAVKQAARYEARTLAWVNPTGEASTAAGLTAGTILASYSFDRFKSKQGADADDAEAEEPGLETLLLLDTASDEPAAEILRTAQAAAEAANRARDLQNLPGNVCDPGFLAERAREIAADHEGVETEILGRAELEAEGMGGLLAVTAGSVKEPALIVLRYSGGGSGAKLGFVGKGVTFDSGGISIKPAAGMQLMKKDMSGGAAVLEATAAIAELGLPVELISVVPAVENMPSGSATRPGDIITQLNGKTVEVNNTDAEGRLILADALTWISGQGAENVVDIATLTGAVVSALGSTHAAVCSNDDEWAERLIDAGGIVGELLWQLPMHREYAELMRGDAADLVNSSPNRKAGTITAAAFLQEFIGEVTWAHLDIAGTSWDVGRPYVGKGATGFGTRLLIELARGQGTDVGGV